MPDHTGLRGDQSRVPIDRVVVLVAALVMTVWLLALPEPETVPPRALPAAEPAVVAPPRWSGPDPVRVPGVLADGSGYRPRVFLPSGVSVGLATGIDGSQRLVLVAPGEDPAVLRRAAAGGQTQYNGFAVSGDILVWAESVPGSDASVSTSLWRANWREGGQPRLLTSSTGDASFHGGQYDIVVHEGRATWTAVAPGDAAATEIRSVPVTGGRVSVRTVAGEHALTTWPWMVGVGGGRGTPIVLQNLETDERIAVATGATEVTACGPVWCRMGVLGDSALVGLDLQRPDGTQRRRIAGPDSTPAIPDVALLDRFIPLTTDLGDASQLGAGLSVYDIERDRTELVADEAANVQGRDGVVWWSTGVGTGLTWSALDLRSVP